MREIDTTTGLAKGSFGIGTFSFEDRTFPGLVKPNGATVDLSNHWVDTHSLLDDWARSFDRLVDIAAHPRENAFEFARLTPRPPIARPNLLCAGANYRQHVAEMMTYNKFNQHNRKPGESDEDFFKRNLEIIEARARDGMPFLWTGLHSSLIGACDDIVLPNVAEQHDWELEITAVIGRTARSVTREQAHGLIAGYTIVNDLGSVDTFRRKDINWGYDWIGKHQPGFKPAGPFIVPAQFVELTDDVRIQLKVNGQIRQNWPVSDMIFKPNDFVSYASERVRLMPGDLVLTGSPPGNGASHGHFLKPDDVIESGITGLGYQRNRCVSERKADVLWKVKGQFV